MSFHSDHILSSEMPDSLADLAKICSSNHWQQLMLSAKPFTSYGALLTSADRAFAQLSESDWMQAFSGHPMIGDINSLEEKYATAKGLSKSEQQQVEDAPKALLEELIVLNHQYKDRFGFIFIICATGQSAQTMVCQLKMRINNSLAQELSNAANEQQKISVIRMEVFS